MVVNKRKKDTRQRGTKWHGYGRGASHHKGAGNRGGRGRAGSGKRADQKKPSYQKEGKHYLGRIGFTSKSQVSIIATNIKELQERLESYMSQKLATKKGEVYTINLEDIGYNKLLATGIVKQKMNITTVFASKSVKDKIESNGGKITILESKAEEASDIEAKEE